MGRHGGGSRGGGSSRSGGSRGGGGSGTRTSSKPFRGSYNRSYYDSRGRRHNYYTSNKNFGTKSGWSQGYIFVLGFITIHMLIMVGSFLPQMIDFGGKVNGDRSRIFITDLADQLTPAEEEDVLELFEQVYEVTGMPITLYTDDLSWREHYQSLEVYSEELYYQIGYEEDAMIILFTAETVNGFYSWQYDIYCGDDTEKCFSDAEFDKVLENFQKGMANQKLSQALHHAWGSVMDELGKFGINWGMTPILLFLIVIYGIFYVSIIGSVVKSNAAYKYFKENPQQLSMEPVTMIYSTCPNCGAANSKGGTMCEYCGSLLKMEEGNTKYVR